MHPAGGPRRAGCLASAAAHAERKRDAHLVMCAPHLPVGGWVACRMYHFSISRVAWHAGQEHMSLAPHSAYQSAASITHADARQAE